VKDSSQTITITRSQARFVSWVAAIALKALLDLIIGFEHRVNAFSRTSGSLGSWPPC
jgi:hypothetical protein